MSDDRDMRRIRFLTVSLVCLGLLLSGCSEDSARKSLFEMQKLAYMTNKVAEQINIQPQLSTAADSTRLRDAHASIVAYYLDNRNNPEIVSDSAVLHDMGRLALGSQFALARYYGIHRNVDSVLTSYNRIGTEIPAGRDDIAGAAMGRALTFRAIRQFDSTIAIYDYILSSYDPPLDYYERANNDVIAIPVDKIKIGNSMEDSSLRGKFVAEALRYYAHIKNDYPDYPQLAKTAGVHTSRVYAITEEWDSAIRELEALTDSTGQTQIESMVLIANIYNGPKEDLNKAIDMYRKIIDRKPDSGFIGQSLLRLGVALCAQKKYEDGRRQFVEIKNKFARETRLLAQAQLYYAQTFREQNRWERSMSELQWLMESYPYTDEAFRAARMIPDHFARENDDRMAEIWYERAIEFYKRAVLNKQGQITALAASSYLADTYQKLEQWDNALETLDKIYASAPRSQLAAKALYNAAMISFQHFNDSLSAQKYLDILNTEFGTTDSAELISESNNNFTVESIE